MKKYLQVLLVVLITTVPLTVLGAVPTELPLDEGIVIDVSGSDVDNNVVVPEVIEQDTDALSSDGSVLPLDQTNLTELDTGTPEPVQVPVVDEAIAVEQVQPQAQAPVEQPLPKTGIEQDFSLLVLAAIIVSIIGYLYTSRKLA